MSSDLVEYNSAIPKFCLALCFCLCICPYAWPKYPFGHPLHAAYLL